MEGWVRLRTNSAGRQPTPAAGRLGEVGDNLRAHAAYMYVAIIIMQTVWNTSYFNSNVLQNQRREVCDLCPFVMHVRP